MAYTEPRPRGLLWAASSQAQGKAGVTKVNTHGALEGGAAGPARGERGKLAQRLAGGRVAREGQACLGF